MEHLRISLNLSLSVSLMLASFCPSFCCVHSEPLPARPLVAPRTRGHRVQRSRGCPASAPTGGGWERRAPHSCGCGSSWRAEGATPVGRGGLVARGRAGLLLCFPAFPSEPRVDVRPPCPAALCPRPLHTRVPCARPSPDTCLFSRQEMSNPCVQCRSGSRPRS